jgi:fructuronate reductase
MHFVRRRAAAGEPLVDPLAARLEELARTGTDGRATTDVAAFLALEAVFARDLAGSAPFRAALVKAYDRLGTAGAPLT